MTLFCLFSLFLLRFRQRFPISRLRLILQSLLGEKFTPESVSVTVKDSYAFAEMKGGVISKIRMDTMKLDAILINRDKPLSDDVKSLSSLIGYSKGELVLLEKDVNDYFKKNTSSGFSNLVTSEPEGFGLTDCSQPRSS